MRTRIALAAIIPVALVTTSTLTQAATVSPARTGAHRSVATARRTGAVARPVALPVARLTAFRTRDPGSAGARTLHLAVPLVAGRTAAAKAVPPPPPALVDTVTPAQRASWERVALCEEGGDWSAGGSRFSGGLGITRSNWAAYGGLQYASEGSLATEDQQIMVAERIQSSPPDQHGCGSW